MIRLQRPPDREAFAVDMKTVEEQIHLAVSALLDVDSSDAHPGSYTTKRQIKEMVKPSLYETSKTFIELARGEFDVIILCGAVDREGVLLHDLPRFIDADIGNDGPADPRVLGTGADEF